MLDAWAMLGCCSPWKGAIIGVALANEHTLAQSLQTHGAWRFQVSMDEEEHSSDCSRMVIMCQ